MISNQVAFDAVKIHGCAQDPVELSLMLNIVIAMDPQVIVEIGCLGGGSLYAWREICQTVIGVTLPELTVEHARTYGVTPGTAEQHGATVVYGDSHLETVIGMLERELDGRRPDFFFIDGDHSVQGCRADWLLAQRVGARCVGFHDISRRRIPGDPGVRTVWAEVSARHPSVEIRNPNDVHPAYTANSGVGIVWPV